MNLFHSKMHSFATTTTGDVVKLQIGDFERRKETEVDEGGDGAGNGQSNNGKGEALIRLIKRHIRISAMCDGIGVFGCHIHRQIFYAQCAKLVALFAVAVAHLLFLHPFLDLFSRLEKYVSQLDFGSADAELIRQCMHDLADYKKNVWMTVAVLCVGLSTSSFFLFLLPSSASAVRKCHVYLIGLIDLVSFGCLPALFLTRMAIMRRVQSELSLALEQAHRLNSAEALMNEIKCTIHPREKLPFCSELILRALIANDLVKFLFILCALTLAYLAVAYLIYWCIKHWIPHSSAPLCHPSVVGIANAKLCCPCLSPQLIVASSSSDRWKKRCTMSFKCGAIGYSPLGAVASRRSSPSASSSKLFAFTAPSSPATVAALTLVVPNPLVIPSEQCSPVSSISTASATVTNEQIPTEPMPTINQNNEKAKGRDGP